MLANSLSSRPEPERQRSGGICCSLQRGVKATGCDLVFYETCHCSGPIIYTWIVYHAAQLCYSDILTNLKGFDDWLDQLGVPVRSTDRAHYVLRVVERAQHAFLDGANKAEGVSKSDYLFGLTEALELHDVYCAFRRHPSPPLRGRLIRALSGPALPAAETAKNRDGRNVMFELALGAKWLLGGAKVDLIEPDLALRMPNRSYLVACKRPEYEHGIRAAVRDAARQLRSALSSTSTDHFGIIAICLSRVLNRGTASSPDAMSSSASISTVSWRHTGRTGAPPTFIPATSPSCSTLICQQIGAMGYIA